MNAGEAGDAGPHRAVGGKTKQDERHAPPAPGRRDAERKFRQSAPAESDMGQADQIAGGFHPQQQVALEVQPRHQGANACVA